MIQVTPLLILLLHVVPLTPQAQISVCDGTSPLCQCDSLQKTLSCNNRNLESVPSFPSVFGSGWVILDLSTNILAADGGWSFRNLTSIEILDLQGNRLTSIPSTYFSGLDKGKIFELSINDNLIEHIDSGAFTPVSHSLRSLHLSGNRITLITSSTFVGLTKLLNLDVSNNGLQQVDPRAFASLLDLQELNLAQNILTSCDLDRGFVFSKLEKLNDLDLSNNNLTHLDFVGIPHLTKSSDFVFRIDLQKNQIVMVDMHLRRQNIKVNLNKNMLTSNSSWLQLNTDGDKDEVSVSNRELDIADNPLTCTLESILYSRFTAVTVGPGDCVNTNVTSSPRPLTCGAVWKHAEYYLLNSALFITFFSIIISG